MIKLFEVQKIYSTLSGGNHVLKDINLYFEKGEFVSIIGKSGCGKTTLLNLISCLDTPSSGQISIDDKLISKMTVEELDEFRNHRIGIIFQNYNLIGHLNVLENVMLALEINGKVEEKKEKAMDMLKRVGLEMHAHKLVSQLSGGQKQRVAIARALVGNPDIILADEPTGALDSKTSKEIMDLIKELCSDKLVILVTHNRKIAEEYSNRIIEMKDGRVISDTKPNDDRVKLDLNRKLIMNKMSAKGAIVYSFKSAIKNKGKTILLSVGLALGITLIALIDGIFNGARNKISDKYLLENNQILNVVDYQEDSLEKVKNMEGISEAYYSPSVINLAWIDGNIISGNNLYNTLSVPEDKPLNNEFTEAIEYGRMPENANEIALSYYQLISLGVRNESDQKNAENLLNKKIVVEFNHFSTNMEEIKEIVSYYKELASAYNENPNSTICIEFDYSKFIETNEFYTLDNKLISDIVGNAKYNEIKSYILEKGVIHDSYNIGYFTQHYSESSEKAFGNVKCLTIVGFFESGFGNINVTDAIKDIKYDNKTFKQFFIIIDYNSISNKVEIVNNLKQNGILAYDLDREVIESSTSEFVLGFLQFIFTAISAVTLLTGAVMLWLLIHVNITQRKREIGLLRSMGATRNDVKGIFVGEAAIIGVLACLISLVLVVLVTVFANWFIPNHAYQWFTKNFSILNGNKPFIINVKKLLIIFGVGILISIIAGLIPASRAGKKKPIESLRGE